ncbi:MAG: outer membrane protein assembly factor BamA [Myxococcota bacterium]|nr:outer membrane protein assembly factor BamA [Myxococcota bacterium]
MFAALMLLFSGLAQAQGGPRLGGGGPPKLSDELGTLEPVEIERTAPQLQTVVSVQVEGNRRIEEAAVKAAIQLRPGENLADWKIRRDIKAVYRTGFFQDVQVDVSAADAQGGVVVTFLVKENPAVRDVALTGNKKIDEEDILEVIDISPYSVLNDADLQSNAQRVRDLYLEKGYFLVEVTPVLREVAEDQVELTFEIVENRKVIVQSLDITGNDGLSDRDIKRFLQTKEGGMAPFLTSSGTFSWAALDTDVQILQQVYLEEGYVDVKVGDPKVYLSPDKRYIYVNLHVEEGPQYKLGHLRVEGDFVPEEGLTAEAAQRLVKGETVSEVQDSSEPKKLSGVRALLNPEGPKPIALETGDTFKLTTLQTTMQRISDLYGDQGYAFAQVYPQTMTDPETGVVDVTFIVVKGEKLAIDRINIKGNDPTWDKVVRREIPLNEGDIYSGSSIREAKLRLQRLGFFEEVRINTPRGEDPGTLDLDVTVVEQPTGSFSVGLGFSNLENFVLTGSVSKNNFLGLGYLMQASINWSSLRRQGNLSFFDPYFMDTRWTVRVDAYSLTQEYTQSQYQRGGGLAVGRYLDRRDDVRLTLNYSLEDVGLASITPYQAKLFGGELYRNGLTSTMGLNFTVDKRNNRVYATQGWFFQAQSSLSGGFRVSDDQVLNLLGGDFNMVESRLNLRVYQPMLSGSEKLSGKFVFRFNSTFGQIASTDGSMVPFIHRYRAGGLDSVRGYNWYSLGPSIRVPGPGSQGLGSGSEDPIGADDRLIVGGTETWVNKFEIEAQILPSAGISGVVFFDAGNAFGDPYGNGHVNLNDMRYSYGAGIRWFSPMGPLRFEWGFPIDPYEDERRMVFDFGIGSAF